MQLFRTALAACLLAAMHTAYGGEAEARQWVEKEFQPSTLAKEKQMAEI